MLQTNYLNRGEQAVPRLCAVWARDKVGRMEREEKEEGKRRDANKGMKTQIVRHCIQYDQQVYNNYDL